MKLILSVCILFFSSSVFSVSHDKFLEACATSSEIPKIFGLKNSKHLASFCNCVLKKYNTVAKKLGDRPYEQVDLEFAKKMVKMNWKGQFADCKDYPF